MATQQSCLFTWDHVDRLPDMVRLARVLDVLPDEALVEALERRRGHGRDDDPVRAMWRMVIAGIVFQHRSVAELLRELGRNPALPEACGFHPLDLPGTRRVVQEDEGLLSTMIVTLREALMAALLRLRRPPGLRRQGDREPFDGPDCRGCEALPVAVEPAHRAAGGLPVTRCQGTVCLLPQRHHDAVEGDTGSHSPLGNALGRADLMKRLVADLLPGLRRAAGKALCVRVMPPILWHTSRQATAGSWL